MKDHLIKNKRYSFAIRIVKLYQFLQTENKEFVMSQQMLRSGTAIGALVRESEHAESSLDFIQKLPIAQKEENETEYWLELLFDTGYLNKSQFESIVNDAKELSKIFASILLTSKSKLKKQFIIHRPSFIIYHSSFIIHN